MPHLVSFKACACNWSPLMAQMLEDNLIMWPQIKRLNLNDNYAISYNGPALKELHARGLALPFAQMHGWPLEKLTVTVTQDNSVEFFQFLRQAAVQCVDA